MGVEQTYDALSEQYDAIGQAAVEKAVADTDAAKKATLTMDEVIAAMGKNPLPDGYISVSLGPNRKVRRMSTKAGRQRSRHFQVWWRTLQGVGIDPKAVIKLRQERKKQGYKTKLPTPRTRPNDSSHHQRRKAGHCGALHQ